MVEEKTLEVATKPGRQECEKVAGDQEGVVGVGAMQEENKERRDIKKSLWKSFKK